LVSAGLVRAQLRVFGAAFPPLITLVVLPAAGACKGKSEVGGLRKTFKPTAFEVPSGMA
jgi:hypothetical protein